MPILDLFQPFIKPIACVLVAIILLIVALRLVSFFCSSEAFRRHNLKQRIVACLGVLIGAGMVLYPPWVLREQSVVDGFPNHCEDVYLVTREPRPVKPGLKVLPEVPPEPVYSKAKPAGYAPFFLRFSSKPLEPSPDAYFASLRREPYPQSAAWYGKGLFPIGIVFVDRLRLAVHLALLVLITAGLFALFGNRSVPAEPRELWDWEADALPQDDPTPPPA